MKTQIPEFIFKPEDHSYWVEGKRIPGVSEILQKVGLTKDWTGVDPWYAERGKMVHLAIQYFLEGVLDENSLDPLIMPYFVGFVKFFKAKTIKPLYIEKPLYSIDGFAGTVDLIAEDAIYDWKCSKSHDRVAELQGEAYKLLTGVKRPFKVVQFPGDGTYKVYDYGDRADTWPSVMRLYAWKTKTR